MLIESIAINLGTYNLISSLTLWRVHCITSERDVAPAPEDTVTDSLRVFIRGEATHPQAHADTRKALNEIARKANEKVMAAAGRLIDTFRASTMDHDSPHVSEMTFLWRYIPEDYLKDLIWRLKCLEDAHGEPKYRSGGFCTHSQSRSSRDAAGSPSSAMAR